jgi:ATP-dependent protease Clp ATPase subunit
VTVSDDTQNRACSFCGRPNNEVKFLIAGMEGNICSECMGVLMGILAENDLAEFEALADKARKYALEQKS